VLLLFAVLPRSQSGTSARQRCCVAAAPVAFCSTMALARVIR
jgi:hypothetical protein